MAVNTARRRNLTLAAMGVLLIGLVAGKEFLARSRPPAPSRLAAPAEPGLLEKWWRASEARRAALAADEARWLTSGPRLQTRCEADGIRLYRSPGFLSWNVTAVPDRLCAGPSEMRIEDDTRPYPEAAIRTDPATGLRYVPLTEKEIEAAMKRLRSGAAPSLPVEKLSDAELDRLLAQ